jgi:hypothetical protein
MSSPNKKQVTFGMLTIQEYPIEMGDNPACSIGAPIQIGWKPQSTSTRNLDFYEYLRQPERRQSRKELMIPAHIRSHILFGAGYSAEEIVSTSLEMERIKKLRIETLQNQGWDRLTMIMIRTGKLPAGIVNGVVEKTGGSFKRAQSVPRDILESTGRALRNIVQPKQKTNFARMA